MFVNDSSFQGLTLSISSLFRDTLQPEMRSGSSSNSQARVGIVGVQQCLLSVLEYEVGFLSGPDILLC